jgi:Domain of unknown function (DUF4157)
MPGRKTPATRSKASTAMPERLRQLLLEEFGEVIDEVKIVEHSWINALHLRPRAVTRRNRIYLRAGAAEFFADPELVFHEYFHVLRQWSADRLTVARYLFACLRYGYWNNPFEREARRFAAHYREPP